MVETWDCEWSGSIMVAWQEKMKKIIQHRLTPLGRLCLYKMADDHFADRAVSFAN